MKKKSAPELEILRRKAQEQLDKQPLNNDILLSKAEILRRVQELEVYKIELDMQNDELKLANTIANEVIELYDFAPTGYFTLTSKSEIKRLNLRGAVLLGRDRLHLRNSSLAFFVSDDSKPVFNNFMDRVFSTFSRETCDIALSDKNSPFRYVQLNGISSKEPDHCLVTMVDITERIRLEETLRESELKYRVLIENSPDTIVIYSQGKVVLANKECINLMKVTGANEILGKPVLQFVHPDYREKVIERMNKIAEDRVVLPLYDEVFIRPDGSSLNVEVKAMPVLFDGGHAVQLNIRDITERKQAENELLRKDMLLNITGETAKVGGWEFDPLTMKQIWTDEVYRIHEVDFSFDPSVGKGINFYTPQSRPVIINAVFRAVKYGQSFDLELELITGKGNPLWVHSIGKAYRENGKTTKVYGSIQDITGQKSFEEQIKHNNAELQRLIAEKDRFFSVLAHDLRGPFGSMLGLIRIMTVEIPDMTLEMIQKFMRVIESSAANLNLLINDLLEWSLMSRGITPYAPESFLLLPKINDSIELIREAVAQKEIRINATIPGDLCVYADIKMLACIFRNLLSNAVKFTPIGGSIHISAKPDSDECIRISVADTGIGMSADQVKNLYRLDLNTCRKGTSGEPGTGLGLMLCKGFIEKHGGYLEVESTEGKGSIFSFTIPSHE